MLSSCANIDTHFVNAAPKSMTIAVFSPPLPNPSNKGILSIYSPSGENKIYLTLTVTKFTSYQKDEKSVGFLLGLVGSLEVRDVT